MAGSFLPSTDRGLLAWSANVVATIGPDPESWGVGVELFDAFAATQTAFADALERVSNPATRTRVNVATKNNAADAVRVSARSIAGILTSQPDLSDADRISLGLTVRAARSTRAAPSEPPSVWATLRNGRTVTLEIAPRDSFRRRLPEDVSGAIILRHVGDVAPADGDWRFVALTSRTSYDVFFDESTPSAAQVWFTAAWFNHRKERSPLANPTSIHLAGGPVMASPSLMPHVGRAA